MKQLWIFISLTFFAMFPLPVFNILASALCVWVALCLVSLGVSCIFHLECLPCFLVVPLACPSYLILHKMSFGWHAPLLAFIPSGYIIPSIMSHTSSFLGPITFSHSYFFDFTYCVAHVFVSSSSPRILFCLVALSPI